MRKTSQSTVHYQNQETIKPNRHRLIKVSFYTWKVQIDWFCDYDFVKQIIRGLNEERFYGQMSFVA